MFTAKCTSLRKSTSFEPFCVKIGWGSEPEKSQKVSDSHRNDVSPLTQGLRYRAACDNDRSFPLCGHPVCVLHKLHNHRENALKHYSVRLLLCQLMTGACVNSRKEAMRWQWFCLSWADETADGTVRTMVCCYRPRLSVQTTVVSGTVWPQFAMQVLTWVVSPSLGGRVGRRGWRWVPRVASWFIPIGLPIVTIVTVFTVLRLVTER